MKTYGKFALLVVAIIGLLVWLAAGGISESKTYYKTVAELNQMGDQARGKHLRVGGDVEDGSIVRSGRAASRRQQNRIEEIIASFGGLA